VNSAAPPKRSAAGSSANDVLGNWQPSRRTVLQPISVYPDSLGGVHIEVHGLCGSGLPFTEEGT
jgi:hypothetical protein